MFVVTRISCVSESRPGAPVLLCYDCLFKCSLNLNASPFHDLVSHESNFLFAWMQLHMWLCDVLLFKTNNFF